MSIQGCASGFESAAANDAGDGPHAVAPELIAYIDRFYDTVRDMSIEESCSQAGVSKIIAAFQDFLVDNACHNAILSLQKLQQEKIGGDYFRADGKTPSILHELRNCAMGLAFIRAGLIPMDEYARQGGLDTDLAIRLRHDSIEDYGVDRLIIYKNLEAHLHSLNQSGDIGDFLLENKLTEAALVAEGVDLMTRKHSKIDPDTGRPVLKPGGKPEKTERHGGDLSTYFNVMMERILPMLAKYHDRTENVATRWGVPSFTLASNEEYARETNAIYRLQAFDEVAREQWPPFSKAIDCADDMLGLSLMMLEIVNANMEESFSHPKNWLPARLGRYLPGALVPFRTLPEVFHPVSIQLHMLERMVEEAPKMRGVIDHVIVPPLQACARKHRTEPPPGMERYNKKIETAGGKPEAPLPA